MVILKELNNGIHFYDTEKQIFLGMLYTGTFFTTDGNINVADVLSDTITYNGGKASGDNRPAKGEVKLNLEEIEKFVDIIGKARSMK